MKVKICGITNLEDALNCEKANVDAIGFVFYKGSKRYINPNNAADIAKKLNPFTLKVGVFVNEKAEEINKITKIVGLNLIQLHGDEETYYTDKLNLPIIKAFRIKDKINIDELNKWKNTYILLDTFKQNEYGGTGEMFDYSNIPQDIWERAIIAGGINNVTIDTILNKSSLPMGVDISSGVEEYVGKKSKEKIDLIMGKINLRRYKC